MHISDYDLAICGAGPVGLALAALLSRAGVDPRRMIVLDARPLAQACDDPRSIALSHGSSQILGEIGAWPIAASVIEEIHVSRRGQFGRTLIDARTLGVPALGFVTRYGLLVDALSRACNEAGVQVLRPATVAAVREDADQVRLTLAASHVLGARIMVQAEGGLFGAQPDRIRSHDYAQTAIVADVGVSTPSPKRAFERFTDEGPLALLPLPQGAESARSTAGALHYALVWCTHPATARRLMALPDDVFLEALGDAFGSRVGRFQRVSARSTYGLGLSAGSAVTNRTVAVGNAAQTLHPVAGQGLNLGLRDAVVLARLLAHDCGPASLPRFIAERRADRGITIRLTDMMARVFASAPEGSLSQGLLGLSLGAIDGLAPAKRLLAEQMMYGRR